MQAYPFHFEDPQALAALLQGVDIFINTYWVRFDHGDKTFSTAVENTKTLIQAAQTAGVKRFVHVSISNPSASSPLPYFKGKAELEAALQKSGLSYAIIRPTVIFGDEDILINNIAHLLRRFPLFAIPGDGRYQLQPIFVEDMADLIVKAAQMDENLIWDAVGPDIFSFDELVKLIRSKVGSRSILIHLPPKLALFLSQIVGLLVRDVILTPDEIDGLMANLLISRQKPTGKHQLSDWLQDHAGQVGARYASELARHYRQPA